MGTRRMIQFETASVEVAAWVSEAFVSAFGALARELSDGVRLAYWSVPGDRRFLALIELADESANPLINLEATRVLPGIVGECVDGGYPRPDIVAKVGSYGLGL